MNLSQNLAPLSEEEKGLMHKRWHMILNYTGCSGEWEQVAKLIDEFLEYRRKQIEREDAPSTSVNT